jgi:hypothetical protein
MFGWARRAPSAETSVNCMRAVGKGPAVTHFMVLSEEP